MLITNPITIIIVPSQRRIMKGNLYAFNVKYCRTESVSFMPNSALFPFTFEAELPDFPALVSRVDNKLFLLW